MLFFVLSNLHCSVLWCPVLCPALPPLLCSSSASSLPAVAACAASSRVDLRMRSLMPRGLLLLALLPLLTSFHPGPWRLTVRGWCRSVRAHVGRCAYNDLLQDSSNTCWMRSGSGSKHHSCCGLDAALHCSFVLNTACDVQVPLLLQ